MIDRIRDRVNRSRDYIFGIATNALTVVSSWLGQNDRMFHIVLGGIIFGIFGMGFLLGYVAGSS